MKPLLTQAENEAAGRFVWAHYARKCGGNKDAKLELYAKATGLGFVITIRCPNCKEAADITDYDGF